MYYRMCPGYVSPQGCTDMQYNACGYAMAVNGKGRVTAMPDRSSVILGVVLEGRDFKIIQQENSARMSQIIAALKKMGISEKKIGTHSYFINTIYDIIDNMRVFKGYRVTNTIKVDISDIQKTGEIIDTAVSSGANLVDNIEFTLSDEPAYYKQALSLAVKDAAQNAKTIGKTLNVSIEDMPVSITEEPSSYIPMAVKTAFASYDAATPIKPGLIDITASVKAVYKYRAPQF